MMKWVHTDLNSPWEPLEKLPYRDAARGYPNQYRKVDPDLYVRLRQAWNALNTVSAEVNEKYPIEEEK